MTERDIHVAMFVASQKGMTNVVRLALLLVDSYHDSALCAAVGNNHLATVKVFFKEQEPSLCALETACMEGHVDILDYMLPKRTTLVGTSLLSLAIHNNRPRIVARLLQDSRIVPSYSSMSLASLYGNMEIVDELLKHPCFDGDQELFDRARKRQFSEDVNNRILRDVPNVKETYVPYTHQTVFNIVGLEEQTMFESVCGRTNLILKIKDSYVSTDRERFVEDIENKSVVRVPCSQELLGAPYLSDVDMYTPYVMLQGNGMYLVKQSILLEALRLYSVLELVETEEVVEYLASYEVVQLTPGVGLQGNPVNVRDSDHCQKGTRRNVYTVQGVVFRESTFPEGYVQN